MEDDNIRNLHDIFEINISVLVKELSLHSEYFLPLKN